MEYKLIELLTLEFERSSERDIRQQIAYRYNSVKVLFIYLFLKKK